MTLNGRRKHYNRDKLSICCVDFLQLESTVAQQRHEQEVTLQKLRAHDEAAKKAINQLQTDLQSKLKNVCHPLPRRIVFILTVVSICDFYLQMVIHKGVGRDLKSH